MALHVEFSDNEFKFSGRAYNMTKEKNKALEPYKGNKRNKKF